jgi:hypothetical protein
VIVGELRHVIVSGTLAGNKFVAYGTQGGNRQSPIQEPHIDMAEKFGNTKAGRDLVSAHWTLMVAVGECYQYLQQAYLQIIYN